MDINKLEQLRGFTVFMDFLKNPGAYEKLIQDVERVIQDLNKAREFAKDVEELKKWKHKEQAKLDNLLMDVQLKESQLAELAKKLEDHKETAVLRFQKWDKELAAKAVVLEQREAQVASLEAQYQDLRLKQARFVQEQDQLTLAKEALRHKEEALKAALG